MGASGVTTAVSGNTLTITVDPYVSGAFIRPGHAGGQVAYGGTGAAENCELYSTTNAAKGAVVLGEYAGDSMVEIDETTGATVITGTLVIQ